MEITAELERIIQEKGRDFGKDPNFVKLSDFYEEMKRLGLATKQPYSLPPLDTVGQQLFQERQKVLQQHILRTNMNGCPTWI